MDLKTLITSRLNDHLEEVRSFVDGLTEEQLADQPTNGNGSLSDIVFHLAVTQESYLRIVSRILTEDLPQVTPPPLYDPTKQEGPGLIQRLGEFGQRRRDLVSLLNALSDHHWKREGKHPVIFHYTLEKCMEEMMRHEESHLFEMYELFFGTADSE